MAEFKGLKADLLIVDDLSKPTFHDLNISEWQKTYAAAVAKLISTLPVEQPKLDPEIEAVLPDVCRRAAKRIADQPQLWCKKAFHRTFFGFDEPRDWQGQPVALDALPNKQQACALGHIEDILFEGYGNRAEQALSPASKLINAASVRAVGLSVAQVNDDIDATPDTIADHLFVVADELEFGDDA